MGKIDVHGVLFDESPGILASKLIGHLIQFCGSSHHYAAHNQVKFALRKPEESKGKKAYRLFLQIRPHASGATVIRPRPPKSGPKTIELTAENLDAAIKAGETWFNEVNGIKAPVGFQGTGSHLVLPGGQFESKHSKH